VADQHPAKIESMKRQNARIFTILFPSRKQTIATRCAHVSLVSRHTTRINNGMPGANIRAIGKRERALSAGAGCNAPAIEFRGISEHRGDSA